MSSIIIVTLEEGYECSIVDFDRVYDAMKDDCSVEKSVKHIAEAVIDVSSRVYKLFGNVFCLDY